MAFGTFRDTLEDWIIIEHHLALAKREQRLASRRVGMKTIMLGFRPSILEIAM